MFTGGGTAGHVTPGLAVLHALAHRIPGLEATWVGSERVESRIVPDAGVEFRRIDIRFSYRPLVPRNFGYYLHHILPLVAGRPFRQGLAAIDALRPDLVVATGGYVSAPVIWAAVQRGVPVALIEINQPPGMVNWIFCARAWRIYAATELIARGFQTRCSHGKVLAAGCPVLTPQRARSRVCHDYKLDPERRILLAMGGSLGAGAIHKCVQDLLFAAARSADPRWEKLAVLNVAGERSELAEDLASVAAAPDGPIQYRTTGYLNDAVGALAASDFYLGRSGAATVGELIATGLPALLIPDPQHADKQQYGNAAVLESRGQGEIIDQADIDGAAVLDWLGRVWDQAKQPLPNPPAADVIADDLLELRGGA